MSYEEFVAKKLTRSPATGLPSVPELHAGLFPFQRDLVSWALRRGRAAIFADTGLGKTRMQIEWAKHVFAHTKGPVLILAPLAVARQTEQEGRAVNAWITVCRDGADVRPGINITNYERLHRFDPSLFSGVVLDESSIIKHHDAKTLGILLDAFRDTPFKLCCTATPSPNDYTELGTHAEFLGACSRTEMLSEFFVHDGGDTSVWRLKGHARKAYWAWVATWAAMLRKPSDLGYSDEGYDLPPLSVEHHRIAVDHSTQREAGMLFAMEASSLSERRAARRASLGSRVGAAIDLMRSDSERWIVWCELNAEQDALAVELGSACLSVYGSLDPDEKVSRYEKWRSGEARILLTKPSIFGFGVNMQQCARMAFVGVTDSWESYYQAVRRCYRFGQTRPVQVHVFASELEGEVVRNLERKEADARRMAEELSAETRDAVRAEVRGLERSTNTYLPGAAMKVPQWLKSEVA